MTGGRNRPSVLSDAFEAVIAAIYLDGGIDEAKKFVLRFVAPYVEKSRALRITRLFCRSLCREITAKSSNMCL